MRERAYDERASQILEGRAPISVLDVIAVEDVCDAVLRRHDALEPPVDIDAIAAAEGLVFDLAPFVVLKGGYVGVLPDGRAHALIREADHPLVQRFTKAHELAHHLLDKVNEFPPGYLQRDRHALHERFAAALLMPRAWVDVVASEARARHELVARIAASCAVTWPAARLRVQELGITLTSAAAPAAAA